MGIRFGYTELSGSNIAFFVILISRSLTLKLLKTKELKFMHRKSIRITVFIIAIILGAVVFSLYIKKQSPIFKISVET